ncbi:MAG: helix-turn-helix domain-containing protein [Alphaproteobacteria bacterium]|nr:helix-turn-helix domain-containing protein [Alphaproteobacteria bacterium]MDA8003714.1 helix-turn-helix domain-containing protein [Alphaproteobacteria bacterium]MDA8005478.1 helix-turn-helix domain-containing protein [Alphaproteobacteria bacterium]MDA8013302.1 helix-turn-helix domain-containing protein [Alphaproteobacteria bacterium]
MPEEEIPIKPGSGNVFADLELRDAERLQVKADILVAISREIRRRKLTQKQAAKKMDITQSDLSRLLRGDFRGYTVDRLTRMLTKVGYDVTVVIRRPARRRKEQAGKMSVDLRSS